jgi:hypothetical protein
MKDINIYCTIYPLTVVVPPNQSINFHHKKVQSWNSKLETAAQMESVVTSFYLFDSSWVAQLELQLPLLQLQFFSKVHLKESSNTLNSKWVYMTRMKRRNFSHREKINWSMFLAYIKFIYFLHSILDNIQFLAITCSVQPFFDGKWRKLWRRKLEC